METAISRKRHAIPPVSKERSLVGTILTRDEVDGAPEGLYPIGVAPDSSMFAETKIAWRCGTDLCLMKSLSLSQTGQR